jgi:hypothetical protein
MANFVAMFYSQRSRKILLNASKTWNTKNELFTLLKNVLDDKYLKTTSSGEDYKKFSDDTFGKILSLLYKENSKVFPYNPETVDSGFFPINYIGKLYKLLNVDYKIYEYRHSYHIHNLYYSFMNEEFDNIRYRIFNKTIYEMFTSNKVFKYSDIEEKYKKEEINPPQVLIINVSNNIEYTKQLYFNKFPYARVKDITTKNELTSMREEITYHGAEYKLDSVILSNYNIRKNHGHSVAGITCKKGKYIYNGWVRRSMDPMMANKEITRNIPCELMPYNWNIKKDIDFCISPKKCIPDILKEFNDTKLCFNFGYGNRVLVYIRKDATVETSTEKEDDIQKYLEARAIALSEERKRALSEERKRALSDERKRALSDERRRALSEERKRALSEERKRALSDERKRALSDERKRALSEERKRALSDERKRALSDERRRALSDERRRALSDERKRAIEKMNEIEKMLSNLKVYNINLKRKRSNSISPNKTINPPLKKYKRRLPLKPVKI